MLGKVLGIKETQFTAKFLSQKLDCNYGIYIDYNEPRYDYIFRYGNTTSIRKMPKIIFNPGTAINLVANKLLMRTHLIQNNVPAPQVYGYDDLTDSLFEKPLIARTLHHFKGKNFNLVLDKETAKFYLNKGYYLQELIDNETEYRIFIWMNEIFETNIKIPRQDMTTQNMLVRNFDNGWQFKPLRWSEVPGLLKEYSKKAMQISGLHFGAVDCCIDKQGRYYIFEINSAPSLMERKTEKLANKILEWIKENL